MTPPTLISIQTGLPQTIEDEEGAWETSFFKKPVTGPISLGTTSLKGDGPADTKNHGGVEKAVLMYAAEHYPVWQAELQQEFPYGAFAENLTVEGMTEGTVCIGDIYQIGEVALQVTQARVPCWKISRRWGITDLMDRVMATGRFGWYCRVLKDGVISAGIPVISVGRPNPEWPVTRAFEVFIHWIENIEAMKNLSGCEGLSADWQNDIRKRLAPKAEK